MSNTGLIPAKRATRTLPSDPATNPAETICARAVSPPFFDTGEEIIDLGDRVGTLLFFEVLKDVRSEGRGKIDIVPEAETERSVCGFDEDEEFGGVESTVERTSESNGIEAATLPSDPVASGTSHTYMKRSPSALDKKRERESHCKDFTRDAWPVKPETFCSFFVSLVKSADREAESS